MATTEGAQAAAGWIDRARAAAEGARDGDIEVVRGRRPPIFDGAGLRAFAMPVVAALLFWGSAARAAEVGTSFDPMVLVLQTLALAAAVRSVAAVALVYRRLSLWAASSRYRLTLDDAGLLLRGRGLDRVIEKGDVLGIREEGDWRERSGGRRHSPVYVTVRPGSQSDGAFFVAIPPVFDRSPGVLAERLMRWRGPLPRDDETPPSEPVELPSKIYDAAAAGEPPPNAVAIPHGRAYLKRGPFASLLLCAAFALGFSRMDATARAQLDLMLPAVIAAALLLVPLGWLWLTQRHVRPRKGLSMLLLDSELLIRTRSGVVRTPYDTIARLLIDARPGWSVVDGYHERRSLVIERKDAPTIRYEEGFLGVPAEVVVELVEARRRRGL